MEAKPTREWKIRLEWPDGDEGLRDRIEVLRAETGLSALTLRVCLLRGLDTAEAIQDYLSPKLEKLKSPFTLKDMDLAVARLVQARGSSERVRIFGDYDVDGTCGAALLSWFLRETGFEFDAVQPDRFKDGYGLNVGAVEQASADGISVLVTVDCGITSFAAAERARELGLDLIVLDHHQLDPVRGVPPAVAVVNPQRPDCESGLRQLCGCGVAFYLAMALRSKGRESGWFEGGKEPNLRHHRDLVVMATAADMVPLTGDNRILVRHGMDVIRRSAKPGVRALIEVSGLAAKAFGPSSLGFVLGPRINASGRLKSAGLALEMLTTTDSRRAMELAQELEKLNRERQELQNQIWDEVRTTVERGLAEGRFRHGIVVGSPDWHEGVVGIVASRVTEAFHKPAIVIGLRDGHGKGSARTYAGKDVLAAIRECGSLLAGFGGHRHAAGVSLAPENLESFAHAFDEAVGRIHVEDERPPLLIEGDCALEDLDVRTLHEIEGLGPFGTGNPEPVFSVRASVVSHRILKGRHLKLNLAPVGSGASRPVEAIWFNAAEDESLVANAESRIEAFWAGVPELNRFRGQVTPTFRVRDWRRLPADQ